MDNGRQRMPRTRTAHTRSFRIYNETGGELKGYLITGEYEDGRLGEIFLKVAKMGSTAHGAFDAFAIMFSIALQYGVPLKVLLEHLEGMYFEPFGATNDEEIGRAKSIMDYVARRLRADYLKEE